MAVYEVSFTLYDDRSQSTYNCNNGSCKQAVQAHDSTQAQAMVEAQYNGCAGVYSVQKISG